MIAENIGNIRKRIEAACFRCGRSPDEITLVGVTKTFGVDRIREAVSAGLLDLGENYAQELQQKKNELSDKRVRWHFIGHLQTNKVKYLAEYVYLIHTVDNERVVQEIQKRAAASGRTIDVLIEVHTTDEVTKSGIEPEKVLGLAKSIAMLDKVRVQGLMTMGPFSDDPEDSRPSFMKLAELGKKVEKEGLSNVSVRHLSMGMSHDFEIAIEEGATLVRIGTAIFGERRHQ